MSKGVQIAGGATLVALLLGWYAASNLEAGASFAYFKTLAEFEAARPSLIGHHARVHGYVALGSIERDVAAKQVRFHVQGDAAACGRRAGRAARGDLREASRRPTSSRTAPRWWSRDVSRRRARSSTPTR